MKLLSTASSSPQLGTDSQTPLMVGRLIEGTAVVAPGFTKDSSSSSSHNFQKRLMARQRGGGNISSCSNSSCHLQARQEGLGDPGWDLQRKGTVSALSGFLPNCFCGLGPGYPSWEWQGAVADNMMGEWGAQVCSWMLGDGFHQQKVGRIFLKCGEKKEQERGKVKRNWYWENQHFLRWISFRKGKMESEKEKRCYEMRQEII